MMSEFAYLIGPVVLMGVVLIGAVWLHTRDMRAFDANEKQGNSSSAERCSTAPRRPVL